MQSKISCFVDDHIIVNVNAFWQTTMLMIKLMSRGVGLCLTQEIVCDAFKTQFHSPL